MEWRNLDLLRAKDEVKFVIADRPTTSGRGRSFARRSCRPAAPSCSRPFTASSIPECSARWILDDGLAVRLQVQLHKYLWPGVERGRMSDRPSPSSA